MILGQIGSMDSPAQLDNIAPTVKLLLRDDWRSLLLELSEMFGRRAQYTRWVRYFEQKAAKARKSLSQKLNREETVMVLIASNNDLRVYGGRRQLGEILYRELKLHPPQGITLHGPLHMRDPGAARDV
ncbi:ABC transporter substrate-binding protein [Paenibacillus sp. TAB 01]|uniref:ABC transporter substrate-binding protein n=1 Tax=Paenibacillus sp. TAB 01 TaxID=3368988 RepID=UPI003751AC13